MSEPVFTPGPWKASNNDGFSIWSIYVRSKIIAQVVGDSAETDCNAHLISAAPDMYEALKVLCNWVADAVEADVGREARGNDLPLAWHKSMAALAKADGAE